MGRAFGAEEARFRCEGGRSLALRRRGCSRKHGRSPLCPLTKGQTVCNAFGLLAQEARFRREGGCSFGTMGRSCSGSTGEAPYKGTAYHRPNFHCAMHACRTWRERLCRIAKARLLSAKVAARASSGQSLAMPRVSCSQQRDRPSITLHYITLQGLTRGASRSSCGFAPDCSGQRLATSAQRARRRCTATVLQ